ncbi:unnamed protein product, partial [Tenebrio molitor]
VLILKIPSVIESKNWNVSTNRSVTILSSQLNLTGACCQPQGNINMRNTKTTKH